MADRAEPGRIKPSPWFRDELRRLEEQLLAGLGAVASQLDRALDAITFEDSDMAAMVVADDRGIDGRYVEVHQGVISLLGRQALFLDDLRLAAALLHSIRCVERMGDQCANIAKLVPLSERELPKDLEVLELVERMGVSARLAVVQCQDTFRARDVNLARDLLEQDREISRIGRAIFQRAVDIGHDSRLRAWAMFMTLVARCLERIAANTVDIAEQALFVRTGLYRQLVGSQTDTGGLL